MSTPPLTRDHDQLSRTNRSWLLVAAIIAAAAMAGRLTSSSDALSGPRLAARAPTTSRHALPPLDRIYGLERGGLLELTVDAGDVVVLPGTGRELRVAVELREDARLAEGSLTWTERQVDADHVVLEVGTDAVREGWFGLKRWTHRFETPIDHVRIELPARVRATVRTGVGDVEASGLDAELNLVSGAGDIDLRGARGPVRARTGAGDVDARDALDAVAVDSGAGDVAVSTTAGEVTVSCGAGDVSVSGAPRGVAVDAGAGRVRVDLDELAGEVRVKTGMGSIELRLPADADARIEARSRLGRVTLTTPGGNGEAPRSPDGARTVTLGTGTHGIRLHSGAGTIDVIAGQPRTL